MYSFCVARFVGVFETVGSLGIPSEVLLQDAHELEKRVYAQTMFGFPDKTLGEHIERAYHAIGIDEIKDDFVRVVIYLTNYIIFCVKLTCSLRRCRVYLSNRLRGENWVRFWNSAGLLVCRCCCCYS